MNNYINKLDNLDEVDKFLEGHKWLKLTLEEKTWIDLWKVETELVIKKLPMKKFLGLDGFTGEYYQIFKGLKAIFHKLF